MHSGGSILADFLNVESGTIKTSRLHAAVRSKEQAQSLARFTEVNVVQMDLRDDKSVVEYIVTNDSQLQRHSKYFQV